MSPDSLLMVGDVVSDGKRASDRIPQEAAAFTLEIGGLYGRPERSRKKIEGVVITRVYSM
jgi:hypothetical protein